MDSFISAREAAQRLRVNVTTVHRWCQLGQLPHKRIGARYWILESAVVALDVLQPSRSVQQPEFLSVGEAARMLNITPELVRLWCREGKIPARKPGACWQIPRQAVVERAQVSGGSPLDADSDYSPLDLRWIKDDYVRSEVEAGNIPHPFLMSRDGTKIDWQAWAEGRLPLQVAEREWRAQRTAESTPTGAEQSSSVTVARVHLVDRIMTNARRFMEEAIAQTDAFSNLQILRLVTRDQPRAYLELVDSFSGPKPFGCAHSQIGKRIRLVAEQSGYVRAPDLDRHDRDLFGNPTVARFFRPASKGG